MPAPDGLFSKNPEDDFKQAATVNAATPSAYDNITNAPSQFESSGTKYVAKELTQGVAQQAGRNMEGISSLLGGEQMVGGASMPFAGLTMPLVRAFLPREWADKLSADPTVAGVSPDKWFSPESMSQKFVGDIKKAPGPLSEAIGSGANFVGQTIANPIGAPAKVGKALAGAFGAGIGSDVLGKGGAVIGGTIGGLQDKAVNSVEDALGINIGDPNALQKMGSGTGQALGFIAGGGLGAQANQMRMQAMKGVASVPIDAGSAIVSALAKKYGKEQDARNLFSIISDDFGSLRADSKDILQQHVNERFADNLRKNPYSQDDLAAFQNAAAKSGIDTTGYDLAQKTNDPTAVLASSQLRPQTPEEANAWLMKNKSQKDAIQNAFKSATNDTVNADSVSDSLNNYKTTVGAKIDAINTGVKQEMAQVPKMNPTQQFEQGNRVNGLYDNEKTAAKQVVNENYAKPEQLANAEGATYDMSNALDKINPIIASTMAKVDFLSVPWSIRNLNDLIKTGKPLQFKDVNDAIVALNGDIRSAVGAGDSAGRIQARNLGIVKDEITKSFREQASIPVMEAYDAATKHYSDVYSPRFNEGVNANLGRVASKARSGEDYYRPEKMLDPYTSGSETAMQQFDNLFGGKIPGTSRNLTAYDELGAKLQNDYAQKVYKNGQFSESAHADFMNQHQPELSRVPEVAQNLEGQADKITNLQSQAESEAKNYQDIVGSPLSKSLGVQESNALVAKALADPQKMNQLIRATKDQPGGLQPLVKDVSNRLNFLQDGEFSPEKMQAALKSGEQGMKLLFTSAMGQEQGLAHFDRLQAIATLAQRQSLADMRQLNPAQMIGNDPVAGATGSSPRSWVSYVRAFEQGRESMPGLATVAGTRFFSQRITQAMNDAQKAAIDDPKMSQAILEMYSKPSTEPISSATAKMVFGKAGDAGQKLIDYLTGRGYIVSTMAKGSQLGGTSYLDKNPPEKKIPEKTSSLPSDYWDRTAQNDTIPAFMSDAAKNAYIDKIQTGGPQKQAQVSSANLGLSTQPGGTAAAADKQKQMERLKKLRPDLFR